MPRKKRQEGTRAPNGAASVYQGSDGRWHGRVTMGVRDNGAPDRRHVSARTEAEVLRKVRDLEKDRDAGRTKRPGRAWTVERWLIHWLENIAEPSVRPKTLAGYQSAVYRHLIPGWVTTAPTGYSQSTSRSSMPACGQRSSSQARSITRIGLSGLR